MFNIFTNDLFLFANKSEICNYADDNTLYSANKDIIQIISNLSNDFETLRKCIYDNYMVLNPDKCHFTILDFQDQNFDFHYKNVVIRISTDEKILGITIDNKLNFKSHVINICTVALCRISNYIGSDKCKLLVNTFVKSQS